MLKTQMENQRKISDLQKMLQRGGATSEQKVGGRWGGENRFAAEKRIRDARNELSPKWICFLIMMQSHLGKVGTTMASISIHVHHTCS